MTATANILCTAKVVCTAKGPAGDGQSRLGFSPDYAAGRNAEWAPSDTPTLSLSMTVVEGVAAKIAMGQAITLLFTEDVDI
mgnify:CR=1 FL=1